MPLKHLRTTPLHTRFTIDPIPSTCDTQQAAAAPKVKKTPTKKPAAAKPKKAATPAKKAAAKTKTPKKTPAKKTPVGAWLDSHAVRLSLRLPCTLFCAGGRCAKAWALPMPCLIFLHLLQTPLYLSLQAKKVASAKKTPAKKATPAKA
jgi:hypothetical protein